ncbi:hypothetical protein BBJ28_00017036, partial [Nothophytophthora sp. Chile5]
AGGFADFVFYRRNIQVCVMEAKKVKNIVSEIENESEDEDEDDDEDEVDEDEDDEITEPQKMVDGFAQALVGMELQNTFKSDPNRSVRGIVSNYTSWTFIRLEYPDVEGAPPIVYRDEDMLVSSTNKNPRDEDLARILGKIMAILEVDKMLSHLLRSYTSKKGVLIGMGLVRRQDADHNLTEADAARKRKSRSLEMSDHANDPSVSSDILAFGLAIFDLLAINHEIGVAASPDESYKDKWERVEVVRERVRQQPTEQLPAAQTDFVKEAEWNLLLGMCAADPAARTCMEDVVYQVGVLAQQENIGHSSTTKAPDTSSATVEDASLYEIQTLGMTLRETLDEADQLCSELETFCDVNRAVCARLVDVFEQLERTRTPLSILSVESFSHILLRFHRMVETSAIGGDSIVASTCAAHTVAGKNYSMHHDIDRLIYNSPVLERTSEVHRWRPTWEQARQRQHKAIHMILENPSSALRQLESGTNRSEAVALLQFSARESGGISSLGGTTPLAQLGGISAEMLPQWFVPAHQVGLRDHIADGSFGAVYRGEWLGTDVVVKQVLTDQENKENRAQFRQEIDVWYSLNHEHLIKLYGACHEGRPFFVCERASQGSILSYVKGFGRSTAWHFQRDAAEGLQHLHDHGVVHGDLKGNNILVSDNIAKLADFGSSIIASREEVPRLPGAVVAARPVIICRRRIITEFP